MILVTGSSGLVGSAVMERFAEKSLNVVGYDRSQPREPIAGCIYEQGNLCDFPRLAYILQKHEVRQIIHCGGLSHPFVGTDSPNQVVQTNIVGTSNVFEAGRLFNIDKIVYLSSGAVYGNSTAEKMTETDRLFPTTVYAVSKLTGELLASVYTSAYGMDIISLRLSSVYGPRCFMPDAVKLILEKAVRGEKVDLDEGADQQLEFLYVKDAALAVEKALMAGHVGERVLNIGSGVNHSVGDVARIVQRLFPDVEVRLGTGGMGYDFLGPFDCSRAEREIGFEAQYSLEEGILDYANYLKDHMNE